MEMKKLAWQTFMFFSVKEKKGQKEKKNSGSSVCILFKTEPCILDNEPNF